MGIPAVPDALKPMTQPNLFCRPPAGLPSGSFTSGDAATRVKAYPKARFSPGWSIVNCSCHCSSSKNGQLLVGSKKNKHMGWRERSSWKDTEARECHGGQEGQG